MNATEAKNSPLRWLNQNFESIFMVAGLISIILFGSSGFSVGNRAQACWGWRSKPPQKK